MSTTASQLVAPDIDAYEDDMAAHWASLGLVWPSLAWNAHGIAEFVYDPARVMLVQMPVSSGEVGVNAYVNGNMPAGLFDPALASAGTSDLETGRGTLTLPSAPNGTRTVRPHTAIMALSGYEPLPAIEGADYAEPPEWYQRTPGVEPEEEVPQVGTIERIDELRYVCETAQPGGNYFTPGTVGSGWRAVTGGEGYDPWDAGTTYAAGDRVTDEGEDWLNRDASNTSRKPGSTAAGWLRISSRPYPYYYLGNAGYPLTVDGEPMQVTDAGRLWQVTQNGAGASSFPPSVVGAGWQDVGPAP